MAHPKIDPARTDAQPGPLAWDPRICPGPGDGGDGAPAFDAVTRTARAAYRKAREGGLYPKQARTYAEFTALVMERPAPPKPRDLCPACDGIGFGCDDCGGSGERPASGGDGAPYAPSGDWASPQVVAVNRDHDACETATISARADGTITGRDRVVLLADTFVEADGHLTALAGKPFTLLHTYLATCWLPSSGAWALVSYGEGSEALERRYAEARGVLAGNDHVFDDAAVERYVGGFGASPLTETAQSGVQS